MQFQTFIPRPPLSRFIHDFWLYADYEGPHSHERILPSGTFEMVFNLREDELRIYDPGGGMECRRFAGALISGPYAGSFMSDAAEEANILGVHFKPGGASAFLGLPAGELANSHVDLCAIWGPSATELRERLCELREPIQRFRLLERALLDRLADPAQGHGAVRQGLEILMGSHGRARISDIARDADLSQRRLTHLFTAEVGLTPKLFARVQRFQHAVTRSRAPKKMDWAELALDCGYFDQSHLVHEFVEFSGVTPADYRRRQSRLDDAGAHAKRHHLPLG
jgi:AraC-like DNA-binding protein